MNSSNGVFVFLAAVLVLFFGMLIITLNPNILGSNFAIGTEESKPAPIADEPEQTSDEPRETTTTTVTSPEETSRATLGENNALISALSYLNVTAFSYSGLIKQLEFEGFTYEEAVYGADNCRADWNEQAALKAENYLDVSSFSRTGLYDQLVFEGFTHEQAEYGVRAVGY